MLTRVVFLMRFRSLSLPDLFDHALVCKCHVLRRCRSNLAEAALESLTPSPRRQRLVASWFVTDTFAVTQAQSWSQGLGQAILHLAAPVMRDACFIGCLCAFVGIASKALAGETVPAGSLPLLSSEVASTYRWNRGRRF